MKLHNGYLINIYRQIKPIVPKRIHNWLLAKLIRLPTTSQGLWRPASQTKVPPGDLPRIRILAIVHVHYEDYLDKIDKVNVSNFSNADFDFIFTTSNNEIANKLSEISHLGDTRVIITENRGRHFGSLFQAISTVRIEKYDFILHLHSKKSLHAIKTWGESWATQLWDALLLNEEVAISALRIMQANPKIGLYYPEVIDIVGSSRYTWRGNKYHARRILELLGLRTNLSHNRFPFPAGGMFLVKTEALRNLLNLGITQDWFSEELGAVDSQLEHAIERLVGYLVTNNGFSHLIYSGNQNLFTTDISFVHYDTSCISAVSKISKENLLDNG